MNKRLDPLSASMRIIEKYFPDCHGAILSGSAARGRVTETSDLDIIVFDDCLQDSYRESFIDFGWPIEVFVHNLTSYQIYFERDCRDGRASLPRMIAEGTVLKDMGALKKIQDEAKALLMNGPEVWTQDTITYKRYFITDLLDDLTGSQNRGERIFIAGNLAERLSEFVLRTNRQWTGSSKWMIRSLSQYDKELADGFMEAFDYFYKTDDTKPIERAAASILEPYGGRLFEGFSLGK